MRSNSIDRIIVGNNNPHNNNTLWVDTSNGEKKAVLKYKGNPLIGGGSGSGSGGSDYQSSGSIVKDMVEQGTNFNWAKYAIDIPSLPCFDQKKIEEFEKATDPETLLDGVDLGSLLTEGYSVVSYTFDGNTEGFYVVVKVTGDSPSVEIGEDDSLVFNDCEPVTIDSPTPITPIRVLVGTAGSGGVSVLRFLEGFGMTSRLSSGTSFVLNGDSGNLYVGVYWEDQLG